MLCSLRKDEASEAVYCEVPLSGDTQDRASNIAADILAIAASGLFDGHWYAARYGHELEPGRDRLLQFCEVGWRQGLMPSAYFDTAYYLARNEDVRAAGVNPLHHYLRDGEREGRWPSPHFDPSWYRNAHGLAAEDSALRDVIHRARQDEAPPNPAFDPAWYRARFGERSLPDTNAFEDYLLAGLGECRPTSDAYVQISDSGLFDAAFYTALDPSFVEDGLDPLYHFCAIGWRRRVSPHRDFDLAWYQDTYDDVRLADLNPLYHFLKFGRAEGRRPKAEDPSPAEPVAEVAAAPPAQPELDEALRSPLERSGLFDVNFYLVSYPDVRASGQDPLGHFIAFGAGEGRRPNPYFDPDWYQAQYLRDDTDRGTNALLHYATRGEARACRPIVYFETEWYLRVYGLREGESPLLHYLTHRRSQRFSPNSCFDVAFYLAQWGSEIGPNRDPFAHFLRMGIHRDIDPSPAFDLARYRRQMMTEPVPPARPRAGSEVLSKIQREAHNPLVHFLLHVNGKAPVTAAAAAA